MNLSIEPGRYVVAVSGGVDSVALLNMLLAYPGLKLTVAHFDHGIRPESAEDRQFVQELAGRHNLPFVYDTGDLGPTASEETARRARYDFLHRVRETTGARAIITAHHEDDLLETAVINLMRGTSHKGLHSLKSTDVIKRPMLHLSKQDLLAYAHHHKLKWHEDYTNQDDKYLRNRIRHHVVSGLSSSDRQQLRDLIEKTREISQEIENLLINQLHLQPARDELNRHWFIMLPHSVAREALAMWLRANDVRGFDTKKLERLVTAAKTFSNDRFADIDAAHKLHINKDNLALKTTER